MVHFLLSPTNRLCSKPSAIPQPRANVFNRMAFIKRRTWHCDDYYSWSTVIPNSRALRRAFSCWLRSCFRLNRLLEDIVKLNYFLSWALKISTSSNSSFNFWISLFNAFCASGLPRGGCLWVQTPPPPKFRRPSKIVPNSNRLWKLIKIAEFRRPKPQDVRKRGSKILKLPRFEIVLLVFVIGNVLVNWLSS